jgi:membrane protein DedA with SNARE-associated domain
MGEVMETLPFADLLGYGLLGIAVFGFLEKFIPIMPSYVLLTLFGLLAVGDAGSLLGVIAASTGGSVLGAVAWYLVGRLIGGSRCEHLFERYGKYLLLPRGLYGRLADAYARNHFWVTALGQTLPTVRIYLAVPAGVIGLSFLPFLLATALGTLAWNAPLVTLGYLLRDTGWTFTHAGIAFAVAATTMEAAVFTLVARRRGRRSRV